MPRVDTYDTPQIQASPLRTARQGFDLRGAHGEGIARGMEQVGNVAQNIALKIQQEDDAAAVKEVVSSYRGFRRQRLFGDEDAFLNRQGRAAYESQGAMAKELEDFSKRATKNLNPRQQKIAQATLRQYLDSDLDTMSKHSASARMDWLNAQDAGIVTEATEDAAVMWRDNEPYIEQIRGGVRNMADRNGWPEEKRDAETLKRTSAAHMSAIDNILAQEPGQAADYFEKHRDEIMPSMHDDVQKAIKTQTDKSAAMLAADNIRAGGGTLKSRLEAANSETDPDRRALVRNQVEHDWRMENQADAELSAKNYDEALKVFVNNPETSWVAWSRENPEAWDAMTGAQQADLKKISAGGKVVTQMDVYYEAKGLIASGDMQAARQHIMSNGANLAHGDQMKLLDATFKQATTSENKPVMTDLQAFKNTADIVIGKEPTEGESRKEWNRRYNVLYGMYQEGLDSWYAENPERKYVPSDVRQSILDKMEIERTRVDSFMGLDFLNPDEEIGLGDIPIDELESIREQLRLQGYSVTPSNILTTYMSDVWRNRDK